MQFADQKQVVIDFLAKYKLYSNSCSVLQRIGDPRNLTLGQAKGSVDIINRELGPMLKHLHIFQLFLQAEDLLEFLGKHAESFKTTEQFLNGTVTGNAVMTGLLNSVSQLMHAGGLEMFFLATKNSAGAPSNFLQFCQALSHGASILSNHLPTLKGKVHEIRVLFDMTAGLSTEKLLPRVESLLKSGQFESCLMSTANSGRLIFQEGQNSAKIEVPEVQIQSLLKGLAVFLNKVSFTGGPKLTS